MGKKTFHLLIELYQSLHHYDALLATPKKVVERRGALNEGERLIHRQMCMDPVHPVEKCGARKQKTTAEEKSERK